MDLSRGKSASSSELPGGRRSSLEPEYPGASSSQVTSRGAVPHRILIQGQMSRKRHWEGFYASVGSGRACRTRLIRLVPLSQQTVCSFVPSLHYSRTVTGRQDPLSMDSTPSEGLSGQSTVGVPWGSPHAVEGTVSA